MIEQGPKQVAAAKEVVGCSRVEDDRSKDPTPRRVLDGRALSPVNEGDAIQLDARTCEGDDPTHPEGVAHPRGKLPTPRTTRVYTRRVTDSSSSKTDGSAVGTVAGLAVAVALVGPASACDKSQQTTTPSETAQPVGEGEGEGEGDGDGEVEVEDPVAADDGEVADSGDDDGGTEDGDSDGVAPDGDGDWSQAGSTRG